MIMTKPVPSAGRKMVVAGLGVLFACVLRAGNVSEPVGVFTDPDTTSFWRTAPSSVFTLDLDYPTGASSVDVEVKGGVFNAVYRGITASEMNLTLPQATKTDEENVYELSLTFDDGTVRKSSFAVISNQSTGDEATAVIGATPGTGTVKAKTVMPLPYGTTALTVDGDPVVSGSTGPQGWFVLGRRIRGRQYVLEMTPDREYEALLFYPMLGSRVSFK